MAYLGRDFVQGSHLRQGLRLGPRRASSAASGRSIQGKRPADAPPLTGEDYLEQLPPVKYRIVAYDYGLKTNILRRLRQHGFQVRVLPAKPRRRKRLPGIPDGIFLSNGPGDPSVLTYAHKTVRALIGKKPIFGICLGHQILGYALGRKNLQAQVRASRRQSAGQGPDDGQDQHHLAKPRLCGRPRVAARGGSRDDPDQSQRPDLRRSAPPQQPVFSVQYHPEAAPGPHDANYFFSEFSRAISGERKSR